MNKKNKHKFATHCATCFEKFMKREWKNIGKITKKKHIGTREDGMEIYE